MDIVPAIDLIEGKIVRLIRGDFASSITYDVDPIAYARQARSKVTRLHVIDLVAARDGRRDRNIGLLRAICDAFGPGVQIGGGVRAERDVSMLRDAGASYVILGTVASRDPGFVRAVARSHPGVFLVGVDTREGRIAIDGWQTRTTQTTSALLAALAGAELDAVIHTEASHDGALAGPAFASLADVCRSSAWPVLAAGGVATLDDVRSLAAMPGVAAAIIGRALLDGVFTLDEACAAAKCGTSIR